MLSKNKKNIKIFLLKIFIFDNFKNRCILHGQVFVMLCFDGWYTFSKILYLFFICFKPNRVEYLHNCIIHVCMGKFLDTPVYKVAPQSINYFYFISNFIFIYSSSVYKFCLEPICLTLRRYFGSILAVQAPFFSSFLK